ncbi:D-sedoheptulose-7-phosphate isomerase [Kineosporia succinea]|uniref:Phosphoheptose isomerase n=1 Tax=Kineosporia succinea TaxID=84632 RepID=A0ABT9NWU3_9ACTN|nr:SIS domain-containing protein [Kineosporia succinea]MDP9824901.1 phosphoheptose isomerase [Kineosporia succinea]
MTTPVEISPVPGARSGPDALCVVSWVEEHLDDLAGGLGSLRRDAAVLQAWGRRLAETFRAGGRVLAAGNGGSAAEAQHLTAELVGRFLAERRPLSALCLSAETSSLTALVNDYGADEMFARQVQAHGRTGDVLVLLSTSGRSPNVLAAAARAKECGITVWALTGPPGSPLAEIADEAFCVDATSTAAVQEVHLMAVHAICAAVDAELLRDGPPVGPRPGTGVRPAPRPGLLEGSVVVPR